MTDPSAGFAEATSVLFSLGKLPGPIRPASFDSDNKCIVAVESAPEHLADSTNENSMSLAVNESLLLQYTCLAVCRRRQTTAACPSIVAAIGLDCRITWQRSANLGGYPEMPRMPGGTFAWERTYATEA